MSSKRQNPNSEGQSQRKKKKGGKFSIKEQNIEPGWSGIYVTCVRGRERQCQIEMGDLFKEVLVDLYGTDKVEDTEDLQDKDDSANDTGDIENDLRKELEGLKQPVDKKKSLISPIDVNCECLLFFRTRSPVDPVEVVTKICRDAKNSGEKKTRHCQRLTPVTKTVTASVDGVKRLAAEVLKPHFHQEENQKPLKFAIKPTSRNHNILTRDQIIQAVAECIGHEHDHKVDLKKYDKLILVDCYKSSLGMSVVEKDYDALEKFNIQRIFEVNFTTDRPDGVDKKTSEKVVAKSKSDNSTTTVEDEQETDELKDRTAV